MQKLWAPASHSHAKAFGTVNFYSDFNVPYATIRFQDGPISISGINGVTNEDVLTAVVERLQALNAEPFHCFQNDQAINHLIKALAWLEQRTTERQERGVEGTDNP